MDRRQIEALASAVEADKRKGYSNVEIARRYHIHERDVRSLLGRD